MRGHMFRCKLFLRSQLLLCGIDLWLSITFLEKKNQVITFFKVGRTLNNGEGVS